MSMTVPPELAARLEALAARRGEPAEALLREAIEEYLRLEKVLDEELTGWAVDEAHAAGEEPARDEGEDE